MSSLVETKEFVLSNGSGDEYFELLNDEGEVVQEGEEIRVTRGDRVRLSFNALHQSSREYAEFGTQYVWEGIVHIDEEGFLVLPKGAKHAAVGELIEIYPQNRNTIRFHRVAS